MSNTMSGSIYRLKISIRDTKPPVWRRIEIPGDASLGELHNVLQTAFGWTDSHLHQFEIGESCFGGPDPYGDETWGRSVQDEWKARLSEVVGRLKRFLYEYDFGDSWEHEILIEKVLSAEAGASYPRCTAGRRACPPEDCGGPWGYAELLAAVADPDHSEHADELEWLDPEFDPEEFDRDAVNAALRHYQTGRG